MKICNSGIRLVSVFAVVGSLFKAHAQVESWSASSGLWPSQASTNWSYTGDSLTYLPAIYENYFMLIDTARNKRVQYFETKPGTIELPSNLTIEFRTRIWNRNECLDTVSPAAVYFGLGGGLGGVFYLGKDEMWLGGANHTRSAGVTGMDTDNTFHTYRLELAGSDINLFYDNSTNPLLTSPVFYDPAQNGTEAHIGFGDITKEDSGTSKWAYLWHNAGIVPIESVPEPTTAALLIAGGAMLLARRNRKTQN